MCLILYELNADLSGASTPLFSLVVFQYVNLLAVPILNKSKIDII